MRRLEVTIEAMFVYNSSIEVPDECETVEQAIEYAKKHMGEIPISSEPEFVHDIAIDEDNCCFAEETEEPRFACDGGLYTEA